MSEDRRGRVEATQSEGKVRVSLVRFNINEVDGTIGNTTDFTSSWQSPCTDHSPARPSESNAADVRSMIGNARVDIRRGSDAGVVLRGDNFK